MLADLLATPGVIEATALRGRAGVMALHGGLEAATEDAARSVAASCGASLYAVVQPDNVRWHVPSIHYDPEQSESLHSFLAHVAVGVSFHGFGRDGMEGTVLLGGTNRRLAGRMARSIAALTDLETIDDLDRIPAALRGVHSRNPVNLPELGGVQVEMSPQARQEGRLEGLIAAVAEVLAAEQCSVCPR